MGQMFQKKTFMDMLLKLFICLQDSHIAHENIFMYNLTSNINIIKKYMSLLKTWKLSTKNIQNHANC